jgi:hypothetical protein
VSGGVVSDAGRGGRPSRPPIAVLRPLGRAAIWVVVAILLVWGAATLLAAPESPPPLGRPAEGAGPGRVAEALAVAFARTYLGSPTPGALRPFLAEGARVTGGRGPSARGRVAQAEVAAAARLGGGRWVLTVSCDLRDARTLDLAVPIVRHGAGEVAVLGAPSIVAVPAAAGPDAAAIDELVARFIYRQGKVVWVEERPDCKQWDRMLQPVGPTVKRQEIYRRNTWTSSVIGDGPRTVSRQVTCR